MILYGQQEAQRCETCRDYGPDDQGHENCGNHPNCHCYGCWPKKQQHVSLTRGPRYGTAGA